MQCFLSSEVAPQTYFLNQKTLLLRNASLCLLYPSKRKGFAWEARGRRWFHLQWAVVSEGLGWKQGFHEQRAHTSPQTASNGQSVISHRNLTTWQRRTLFEVHFYSLRCWYCFWQYFSVPLTRGKKWKSLNPSSPSWHPAPCPIDAVHFSVGLKWTASQLRITHSLPHPDVNSA